MDIFCEIPCLTDKSKHLSGKSLQKEWFKSADKRYIGQYIQKFIDYNIENFEFLGVHPYVSGIDQNISLWFSTSNYIGSIPLRAPDTGKQIGDFVVRPRFSGSNKFEEYIDIISLLDKEINPEVKDSLPLNSGANFRPPMYLEALKFINSLELLTVKEWKKFKCVETISSQPTGRINWDKYSKNEYKVENRLKFPVNKNILSEYHEEYSQLKYVFDICRNEIRSSNTPIRIRNLMRGRLITLEERLYNHNSNKTKQIHISYSDSPIVKECKLKANKILESNYEISTAWRVDFSDVFEKYVQYIFKEVAKEIGGSIYPNFKITSKQSKQFSWELKYVEPDVIYSKGNILIFIDAKYKSHLYNKYDESVKLKEDYRHDLHQIMAYSSFSNTSKKYGFLCYPAEKVEISITNYFNSINQVQNTVFILGVPLKKDVIPTVKDILIKEINNIDKEVI